LGGPGRHGPCCDSEPHLAITAVDMRTDPRPTLIGATLRGRSARKGTGLARPVRKLPLARSSSSPDRGQSCSGVIVQGKRAGFVQSPCRARGPAQEGRRGASHSSPRALRPRVFSEYATVEIRFVSLAECSFFLVSGAEATLEREDLAAGQHDRDANEQAPRERQSHLVSMSPFESWPRPSLDQGISGQQAHGPLAQDPA